jgi:hypothetical protein
MISMWMNKIKSGNKQTKINSKNREKKLARENKDGKIYKNHKNCVSEFDYRAGKVK